MKCTIDIKREGNFVISYLPFNPRMKFGILKGSIYVKCTIDEAEFKSKLVSRGNEKYCIFLANNFLKILA